MKLFHGSNMEIRKVELSKCMPNKDFGCGFYTTLLEEQAWRMAQRRVKIDGGTPVVMVYEVPDNEDRGISLGQAMEQFYMPDTFEKLSDIGTCLYLDGSAYVYEMLKKEIGTKE